ncbi:hypothetical protein [Streptomyces mirabilis]|uniref:hypothetical protein n=1 Tax=Streptomyces mirabilis TaxID=68239 RepID=UPI0033B8E6AD
MHSQAFDTIARAKREGLSCAGFLAEQLMAEREDRDPRRAECHIRAAHFPREKSPQEFDHGADSHVDRAWLSCLTEPRTPGRRGERGQRGLFRNGLADVRAGSWRWPGCPSRHSTVAGPLPTGMRRTAVRWLVPGNRPGGREPPGPGPEEGYGA